MNPNKLVLALIICLLCGIALLVVARQQSKSEIPPELIQQLIADINGNENNFRLSEADLEILNANIKFELHDLNSDGVSEVFIYIEHSDWCGAGSNCSYWIYQRTEQGYDLLLEDKVLRVKDTVTNGYRDLTSETPMGFCDRNVQRLDVTPYKYDGEEYQAQSREVECRAFTPREN